MNNTYRAKDPSLNEIAVKLKTLPWVFPLDPEEQEECHEKLAVTPDAESPGGVAIPKRKLVHPMPGAVYWNVRMYLGGEQRTIGICHVRNIESAFRFADMAQQYFWKYRVRATRPPSRIDLNLSPERVESDMANEPQAVDLLRQIEDYLLQIGALQTSEQRHAEKKEKREQRKQGGLKATITRGLFDLNVKVGDLHEGVGTSLQQLEDRITTLTECVNTLRGKIEQQDASLGKVLARVVQDLTHIKQQQPNFSPERQPDRVLLPQKDVIGWPLPVAPTSAPPLTMPPLSPPPDRITTGDPLPPNPTTVC